MLVKAGLKERATANEIKREPEQKQGGESHARANISLLPTAALKIKGVDSSHTTWTQI